MEFFKNLLKQKPQQEEKQVSHADLAAFKTRIAELIKQGPEAYRATPELIYIANPEEFTQADADIWERVVERKGTYSVTAEDVFKYHMDVEASGSPSRRIIRSVIKNKIVGTLGGDVFMEYGDLLEKDKKSKKSS